MKINCSRPRICVLLLAGALNCHAEELPHLPEVDNIVIPSADQAHGGSVDVQVSDEYEASPVLKAADVLSADHLSGPHFRVRNQVLSDGFLYHFTIDSDFGVFQCAGMDDVAVTLSEIEAIAKLVEVSKGDLFADALKQSINQPIDAVKNIAHDPVGSVKQVPKTVGHFFSKVGSSVGNAAKRLEKNVTGDSDTGDSAAALGKGISEGAKSIAGFDKAKLDCARQLGIDPYSDNERLQTEMEKVAWAFFAGGLPLRAGAMVASGGASAALTATNTVGLPGELYDLTPGEIALRDREMLGQIGADEELINSLFLNPILTTSRRHEMVKFLSQLPASDGRLNMI